MHQLQETTGIDRLGYFWLVVYGRGLFHKEISLFQEILLEISDFRKYYGICAIEKNRKKLFFHRNFPSISGNFDHVVLCVSGQKLHQSSMILDKQ